jgi:hypothetical protein
VKGSRATRSPRFASFERIGKMKIVASLLCLAGLLTLGACNSPTAPNAVDPRAAPAAQKPAPKKIVGYSDQGPAAAGYGEGLGDSGGGGHHH